MIGSATEAGTLAQVLANVQQDKLSIATLTQQESSGYVAPTFAGLGLTAPTALALSRQVSANAPIQATIKQAGSLASAQQTVLQQVEQVASGFAATLNSPAMQPGSVDNTATQARAALQQVANLLDTKVGDVYLFAGQDSRTPPVPNPDQITSSAFFTAIQGAVQGLTANGLAATTAATLAAAQAGPTSPFAASLEASNTPDMVDLGSGGRFPLLVLADKNSDAVSTGVGTTSTGSYMRDILRGIATIASMSDAQVSDPNFQGLVTDTLTGLQGAVSAINADISGLGARQTRLTETGQEMDTATDTLQARLTDAQEVDLPTIAAELSASNTRLQASFQVIASMQQLSLARLLPAG